MDELIRRLCNVERWIEYFSTHGVPTAKSMLGVVNVKSYGAKGDGVTDDTAAVQAAVSAAGPLPVLLAPGGTYKISGVTLPNAPITLVGYGATISSSTAGSYALSQTNRQRVTLQGLSFSGVGSGFRFNMAPSGTQSYDVAITDCSFVLPTAQIAVNLTGAREATITTCYFETMGAVYLHQSINTHVIGCQFKNCAYGTFGDGSTTSSVYDAGLFVQNCTMIGCTYGVRTIGWDYWTIMDCMIDYCDHPVQAINMTSGTIGGGSYISAREYVSGSLTIGPVVDISTDLITYPTGSKSQHFKLGSCQIISHATATTQATSVGISIANTDEVTIHNNAVRFWRQYGVQFTGVNNFVRILANNFDSTSGATDPTATGPMASIYGTAGNDSTWVIDQNEMTKPILNTSFAPIGRSNRGYISDQSGQSLITAGTTSVAVTFPGTFGKTPNRVTLTAASPTVGALGWTGLTTTGMTINCATAPAANASVVWRVWFES